MKDYILYLIQDPRVMVLIVGALSTGWLLLFVMIIVNMIKTRKASRRIEEFLGISSEENSLENRIDEFIENSKTVSQQEKNIIGRLESVDSKLSYTLQRIGIVRYNPFPEVGGDLSFSIALLDNTNSGFVITGIYTRQGSFTYLKPVRKGRGDEHDKRYRLSREETEAVQRAIASH